jgi:hypothetical protein
MCNLTTVALWGIQRSCAKSPGSSETSYEGRREKRRRQQNMVSRIRRTSLWEGGSFRDPKTEIWIVKWKRNVHVKFNTEDKFQSRFMTRSAVPGRQVCGTRSPSRQVARSPSRQVVKSPSRQDARSTKFWTVVPNICGSSVQNLFYVTFLAPEVARRHFSKICGLFFLKFHNWIIRKLFL